MMSVLFAVLFSNLVWGLSPLLANVRLQNVSDVAFLLIRFALSTVLFFPVVIAATKKLHRLSLKALLLGIATVAIHYYLQVVALRQVPVTWYVFFYSLCPFLNLFVVRAELSRKNLMIGMLAIFGTALFIDFASAPQITLPMILVLIASVLTWVLFTWTVKQWQSVLSDAEVSATTSALSLVIFASWAVFSKESIFSAWNMRSGTITLILSVLLPVAFLAYSYSLRRNPEVAVLGQYAEPVVGTLGSLVFLGETLTWRQGTGLGVVAVALWVLLAKPGPQGPVKLLGGCKPEMESASIPSTL